MDVLYISCDIVTYCAIASGECSEELAVAVGKTDGCSVKFQLAAEV